jgi:MFS family permease
MSGSLQNSTQKISSQHLNVFQEVLSEPRRYARPWYFAYLLSGLVASGMVPILLPLMMASVSHDLSSVAYVMGAYDFGLLSSPLWGIMAERNKQYRALFFTGFLLSALAIGAFPFIRSISEWMPLAFAMGVGFSGASTVSSLLIVDFEPSNEWEPRIGLLQSFNGIGQVIGLLLAGIFSHGSLSVGLWIAAIILIPALILARVGLPAGSHPHETNFVAHFHHLLHIRSLAAFPHINFPSGIGFHFHDLNMSGLRHLSATFGTRFARFLLSWFLMALGVAGFFTYFPLMLNHSYGINSHFSSVIYAVVAGIGIVLFVLAAKWSEHFGVGKVYKFGLWIRITGFFLLFILFFLPGIPHFVFGAIGFGLIVIAWPILSVSATNLAAQLTPISEGAAMGLFNMAFALATVIGAFASGPLIAAFGYQAITIVAMCGLGLSIILG